MQNPSRTKKLPLNKEDTITLSKFCNKQDQEAMKMHLKILGENLVRTTNVAAELNIFLTRFRIKVRRMTAEYDISKEQREKIYGMRIHEYICNQGVGKAVKAAKEYADNEKPTPPLSDDKAAEIFEEKHPDCKPIHDEYKASNTPKII